LSTPVFTTVLGCGMGSRGPIKQPVPHCSRTAHRDSTLNDSLNDSVPLGSAHGPIGIMHPLVHDMSRQTPSTKHGIARRWAPVMMTSCQGVQAHCAMTICRHCWQRALQVPLTVLS